MMQAIRNFFTRRAPTPPSDTPEPLFNECLECGHSGFLFGPRGGMCINVKCGNCGEKYNLLEVNDRYYLVDRLGNDK